MTTKTPAQTAADRAIARSVSHNEIVTVDWTEELQAELSARCDDSVDASREVWESWGTNDDGEEWRVHLRREIAEVE